MSFLMDFIKNLNKPQQQDKITCFSLSSEQSISKLEERQNTKLPYEKFEYLYKLDPIIFRCVNEYINGIASGFVVQGGEDSERETLEKWCNDSGLLFTIQELIQDILLYGNGFAELDINYSDKTMRIISISPKTMDYIRNKKTGMVELDEQRMPIGFVQEVGTDKIEWLKDKIIVNGNEVVSSNSEDLRERIIHLYLWKWGESYLGITPLLSVYNSAIIRLNLSDSIGETAFRGGGLVAQLHTKIPEAVRKDIEDTLKNSTSKNIFVMDDKIELKTVPIPDIQGRDKLVYYFADEVATGMGVPLSLMMSGIAGYSGERELKVTKWEESLKPLQLKLAYQIRKSIFKKFWGLYGFKGEIPTLIFKENTPFLKLNQSRTVATYARRGLIKRDPDLEMSLRTELGLPITSFLKEEREEWIKNKLKPQDATEEIDNKVF